jgi:molybdate/tungstate transport system permease protein
VFAAAGLLLLLFVLLPLLSVFLGVPPSLLLETLKDQEVQRSVALTFYAGAVATLCAGVTGVPLAFLLARYRFPGKSVVEGVVDLPLVIPHTAAGVALLTVFGAHGWVGGALAPFDVRFTDSIPGIVVAMLFVGLPFLVDTAPSTFETVDPEPETVAEIDGVSRWQAFVAMTLPLAWRGVLA